MRPTHLHAAGGNRPNRALEIELDPIGVAQLAGARVKQGEELETGYDFRRSVESSDCLQKPRQGSTAR